MELVGSLEAGTRAKKLLEAFRRKALPVIHVQHIATHAGATFFCR
jgi:nicotinamidase-related amidase